MFQILDTIKENPLLTAAMGLSGAGIITFWIKDFPVKFYRFLKRQFTTELIVTNQHIAFYNIMEWIQKNYKNKNFRQVKITNGRWGYDDNYITSIGYGAHFIKYKNIIFFIQLIKEEANNTERDKETLRIVKIGRDKRIFESFVFETQNKTKDCDNTKIYKMNDCWEFAKEQPKRHMETVFIEKSKKDILLGTITKFKNREKWYLDSGIPYQLGILLHGEPGTGKTSLIKAIAGYLNYSIYYLSPSKLDKIELAMSSIPNNCVVVIEDIDTNNITHNRENSTKPNKTGQNIFDSLNSLSLSEILNSLDGMLSSHGRVLIATTNHIEHLDKALIRAGRIDLKIEIGFVNNEILQLFLNKFYKNTYFDCKNIILKDNITVAMLQQKVLEDAKLEDIINFVKKQTTI